MLAKSLKPGRSPNGLLTELAAGALIIGVSLAVTFAWKYGWVSSPDLGFRVSMVLSGAYLMFTGNAIPKTLKPFGCLPHDSTEAQTFRRFAGWTWVVTGLALVVMWCAAPLTPALVFTLTGVPLAIVLVLARRRSLVRG